MDILDGLNPEQRAAVQHGEGPLLVVAGAGTGKTQVITRRIAHLIARGAARPAEILALTFTEKAAREMQERLYDLIGWESFQVPVMTFHAFGAELLGRFAAHIGRSVRGGLLNDMQKALLIQQHFHRVNLRYYGPQRDQFEFLEGVVAYIGLLQNAGITVADYMKYVEELRAGMHDLHPKDIDEQADLLALFDLYEGVKAETGTFDYNDQLHIPLQILQQHPNLAQRLAQEYRYILVDEYQDTNAVQDALLRTFIGAQGNLLAVGDDDQAIYGFRGAEIGNILAFAEHFELARPVVLTRNYRSGQAILDCAYALISHNDPDRLESKLGLNKRLMAQHNDSSVTFVPYRTLLDEQEGVLEQIERRIAAGERPGSIAVLAATHAPLRGLAKSLRARRIGFALSAVANIFEQPELIGLWHLLKWLGMEADDEAIGHVIMGPMVGWKAERYRQILELSRERLSPVEEALRADQSEDSQELARRLDEWRNWAREMPVSQLVFKLVFDTGKADEWRDRAKTQGRIIRVFEDLQRLLEHMQDFETVAMEPMWREYSKLFPKPPVLEVHEPVGDTEGVQLLTVHASKGLEFDAVYLIGCTQRNWSSARGAGGRQIPEALRKETTFLPAEHEMRRLLYVAVTRAKRSLVVSAATYSLNGAKQAVSPFVGELLGPEVLHVPAQVRNSSDIESMLTKLQRFYPLNSMQESMHLPFETTDGWLEVSVTGLGAYEYCPFEFYIEEVLGIRQPLGPQLAFGNVLHRVLEMFFKAKMAGRIMRLEELHEMVDQLWASRGYETRDMAEADRKLAHRTLEAVWHRDWRDCVIQGSEVPIRFEVPEAKLRLRGKVDALLETVGGVEIRDFKTGRTKTSADKLAKEAKENFQLRTYALAYEALKGQMPDEVVLDYIVTGVIGRARLSKVILQNHRGKLVSLAGRIRARDFAPNPSPLHRCGAIRYYGTGERDALAEELLQLEKQ